MVFMNMGDPFTTTEAEDVFGRFQKYLGPLIAKRRPLNNEKQYAAIGGVSLVRKWSEYQAEEMCSVRQD